jgi:hypothetical protein
MKVMQEGYKIDSKKTKMFANASQYFTKCVRAYHRFNAHPIKEALWEDINAQVLQADGHTIHSQSRGSHQSGADIDSSAGVFSNKSSKYDTGDKSLKISSYRLTNVCNTRNTGDLTAILSEIQKRKNFGFYSLLVRKETPETLIYDWYVLPADYKPLDPATYDWEPKYNKKNEMVGWKTNTIDGSSMSISFNMSSQLWMTVRVDDDFKQFRVASCEVPNTRAYNYIELDDLFNKALTLKDETK